MSTPVQRVARLLFPAVRWNQGGPGFSGMRGLIEDGLARGVGGFILFGGDAEAVRALTAELHERAPHALLIGSDLERGAGQQFRGATPLPPAAALGALGEPAETTRRAGELTAREARALGVNWIYAPVADVDLEPENPIVGTRAFSRDPDAAAAHVAAWVEGCRAGGALACAKHFPGHGRTVGDSHIARPVVAAPREALEADLDPFRAAIAAGVDSVMAAHVAYPALDPAGDAATLSPAILEHLLRDELGFDGLVATDAIDMAGFSDAAGEADAAVRAVAAGADALLYPRDAGAVARALEAALAAGRLEAARVERALARIAAAAERAGGAAEGAWGREADRRWALETAVRALRVVRGTPALPAGPVRLIEVEDDLGGPWPPYPRTALPDALRRAGVALGEAGAPLVAVYSDIRAWKGRPGLSAAARAQVRDALAAAPEATVLFFSHPRLADELPGARHLLAAWGGEPLMQEAAAAWLTGTRGGLAGTGVGVER